MSRSREQNQLAGVLESHLVASRDIIGRPEFSDPQFTDHQEMCVIFCKQSILDAEKYIGMLRQTLKPR